MVDQVMSSLGKAHSTIRNNLVVLWFPALFSTAVAVFIMLAAIIVLLPVMPDLLTTPDILSTSPEILNAGSSRMLLILGLAIPVVVVANAGAVYMQARAVKGEQVDTASFFSGVRTIGARVLIGNLVVWGCYVLVLVLSVLIFAQRLGTLLLEYEVDSVLMPEVFLHALPLMVIGTLLVSMISVLFSMWARVLALREVSVMQALSSGARFVLQNFLTVAVVLLATWLLTTFTQPLVERLPLGRLLVLVFSYVARVYMSVFLMHFYIDKTGM